MSCEHYSIRALCLVLFVSSVSSEHVLTFNRDVDFIWHQAKFDNDIDGSVVPKNIVVQTIHFPDRKMYSWEEVDSIVNFPVLTMLYMDNYSLTKLPLLGNLPSLIRFSISKNDLIEINNASLANLPVEELFLSNNKIQTIARNSFGPKVKELLLTCNNLTEISEHWFTNKSSLIALHLGGNRITAVPENMFKYFTNLNRLELRNNQIVTIGDGAFSGFSDMYKLHLGYNNISEIKPSVFKKSTKKVIITYMDIQYNRLSFLSDELLSILKVETLKIWGNPWQCPCATKIRNWLNANRKEDDYVGTSLQRDEDPSCVYALSFSQSCVPFVDPELYTEFLKNFKPFPVKLC